MLTLLEHMIYYATVLPYVLQAVVVLVPEHVAAQLTIVEHSIAHFKEA